VADTPDRTVLLPLRVRRSPHPPIRRVRLQGSPGRGHPGGRGAASTPDPGAGEGGEDGEDCPDCQAEDLSFLWTDRHWRVGTRADPKPLFFVLLHSRAHHQELTDLPPGRAAELGPLLQRMEAALRALGDVGRVHTHRWGGGGAHLHLWQIIRPEGMVQANGVGLPVWLGAQPDLPKQAWDAACAEFTREMARGGGTAHR
jgi:diadenosine tetraphosphate (Ap4A) HIT family hydrolase